VDLVVMAIHARDHLSGYLHASVAEQVLARSRAPLLLVHGGHARRDWQHVKALVSHPQVLVVLDGSPATETSLPVAARLAESLAGELLLEQVTRDSSVRVGAPDSRGDCRKGEAIRRGVSDSDGRGSVAGISHRAPAGRT
jgi:nucleotide-binding universal stress UspA family protein